MTRTVAFRSRGDSGCETVRAKAGAAHENFAILCEAHFIGRERLAYRAQAMRARAFIATGMMFLTDAVRFVSARPSASYQSRSQRAIGAEPLTR